MNDLSDVLSGESPEAKLEELWRKSSNAMNAPSGQQVELFCSIFNAVAVMEPSSFDRYMQLLDQFFSDLPAVGKLNAMQTLCHDQLGKDDSPGALAKDLLPNWLAQCVSLQAMLAVLQAYRMEHSTLMTVIQIAVKLPRISANLLGKLNPSELTPWNVCSNIVAACIDGSVPPLSEEAFGAILAICGRDGVRALARTLTASNATQLLDHIVPNLSFEICDDVLDELVGLIAQDKCTSIAPLESLTRQYLMVADDAAADKQRERRQHVLINKLFFHKRPDYRVARAFVEMLHRNWRWEMTAHDSNANTDDVQFFQILLEDIARVWGEPFFNQQGHIERIKLLTRVLCVALDMLDDSQQTLLTTVPEDSRASRQKAESVLSMLCRGVSNYFDSNESIVRNCGMAVGMSFARIMRQQLQFEEFVNPFTEPDKLLSDELEANVSRKDHECPVPQTEEQIAQLRTVLFDVAPPDFGDMNSLLDFFHPLPNVPEFFRPESLLVNHKLLDEARGYDSDSDSDELVPYDDADETMDDLRTVPKPRYLRACLDMLRIPADQADAIDKHMAAFEAIPDILAAGAHDSTDLASSLVREVLRTENRAHEATEFASKREKALVALCVAEPKAGAEPLIAAIQDKEYSMGTRIEALHCMVKAALQLSAGQLQPTSKDSSSSQELPSSGPPSGMRIVSSRIKRTVRQVQVTRNLFVPVAYGFFYPVLHALIACLNLSWANKADNSSPSNYSKALTNISEVRGAAIPVISEDRIILATHFFSGLSEFVRCCVPQTEAQIMAQDLVGLLCQLEVPENLGLRRAVLLVWHTCIIAVGRQLNFRTMEKCMRVATTEFQADPDPQSRAIAQGILSEIRALIDPQISIN